MQKGICMTFLLLLVGFMANVDTYDAKLQEAKDKNQWMLLLVTSEGCGPCRRLKRETLSDPRVTKVLSVMVVYHVSADSNEGTKVVNMYNINGIPTYFMINPHRRTIFRRGVGYKSPTEFLMWILRREEVKTTKP